MRQWRVWGSVAACLAVAVVVAFWPEAKEEPRMAERFEPVRVIDLTRNLLHPGVMLLYLPRPLPEHTLFGRTGHWLRLSRSSYLDRGGGWPWMNGVELNIVGAVQREQAEDELFSAGPYEAGLTLELLHQPVLDSQVWVDESASLAMAEAEQLARELPDRVRMEWEDGTLAHCWVAWERRDELERALEEEDSSVPPPLVDSDNEQEVEGDEEEKQEEQEDV